MVWKSDIYGAAYENYQAALENAGIRYLANGSADLDGEIRIYGLDLPKSAYLPRSGQIPENLLKDALGEPDPGRFNLLLAHSPLFLRSMRPGERILRSPDIFTAARSGFRSSAES